MLKKRLHYIDLTKGILILMVAYGHVWYRICHTDGYDNLYMTNMHEFVNLWVAFFMPAFFVITGMCSNFEKARKTFLLNQIKTILIPAFTLGVVSHIVEWALAGKGFSFGITAFLKGNTYWFLFALFTAKVIYYGLHKLLVSLKKTVTATFILFLLIVLVHEFLPQLPNYWCWTHALGLMPFLAFGQILRKYELLENKKVVLVSGGVYVIILTIYMFFGVTIPRITGGIYLPAFQMLPYLALSCTGSLILLAACKVVGHVQWLESLGKHSLVIYCLHENMLTILSPWLGDKIVQATLPQAFVYYTMLLIYVIVMSWFLSLLLCKKPMSFIIGKF